MRLKLEIAGGVILLALISYLAFNQYQKAVGNAVATQLAEHDRARDAQFDQQRKSLESQVEQLKKDYEQKTASLQKLTPQQIVVKLPDYVPQATSPVQIVKSTDAAATSGQAHAGDAIVPQADIKPIAQALLDGANCSKELSICKQDSGLLQQKYQTKADEAAQWQKAAKGGSVWKRLSKDVLKIAIGVGVGYAIHR